MDRATWSATAVLVAVAGLLIGRALEPARLHGLTGERRQRAASLQLPIGLGQWLWLALVAYVAYGDWQSSYRISATVDGFLGLAAWMWVRSVIRSSAQQDVLNERPPEMPFELGIASTALRIRSADLWIWRGLILIVLLLLPLALWQAALELGRREISVGLLVALAHLYLVMTLLRIGLHTQEEVILSPDLVVARSVLGVTRKIAWHEIAAVHRVRYVGPGRSGLYLYDAHERNVLVLDAGLPWYQPLESTVRARATGATWKSRVTGRVLI